MANEFFVKDGEVFTNPMPGQTLHKITFKKGTGVYEGEEKQDRDEVHNLEDANGICSKIKQPGYDIIQKDLHKPIIDIDIPCKLIPSSTDGHFHLYIDKALTWMQYLNLLYTLADVGIVEPGYVAASVKKGGTDVRLPWIKKTHETID